MWFHWSFVVHITEFGTAKHLLMLFNQNNEIKKETVTWKTPCTMEIQVPHINMHRQIMPLCVHVYGCNKKVVLSKRNTVSRYRK